MKTPVMPDSSKARRRVVARQGAQVLGGVLRSGEDAVLFFLARA
jgi:hypothetical protein